MNAAVIVAIGLAVRADPDGRVAALAMERTAADDLERLQARRKAIP